MLSVRHFYSTCFLCTIVLIGHTQQPVQQVIASLGSYSNNGTVSLSTTVGEAIITTHSSNSSVLTQGFQQPEYFIISSINETLGETLQIKVYPNPSAGNINIDLKNNHSEQVFLTVTDMLGQIVLKQNLLINTINQVDLQEEANGQYVFGITDKSGVLLSTHHVQKIR